jgi:hypothetical protein
VKYAKEVIDLLAAYPGRRFRMIHIVRHVAGGQPGDMGERERIRKGVRRVLEDLESHGQITRQRADRLGTFCTYAWKSGT